MSAVVTVALDWTPNGNHLGFYVAKKRRLYADAGLDVRLVSPHDADYAGSYVEAPAAAPAEGKGPDDDRGPDGGRSGSASSAPQFVTPCSKVAKGEAQMAINSPEGVVGWNVNPEKVSLTAVAALLYDRNTSAIVTLKDSGRARPKDLDGARYASYAARFEGRIVQKMIQNDGGEGDFQELTPPMLGIWNTLLGGGADATWAFLQWEGVEAAMKDVELNVFKLLDFGIPYAYAPCLCADPSWLDANRDVARKFLAATAEGYKFAAADPVAAAAILVELAKTDNGLDLDPELARGSAVFLADKILGPDKRWGAMDAKIWSAYVDWLWESGLLTDGFQSRHPDEGRSFSLDDLRNGKAGKRIDRSSVPTVFTNKYLPE